MLQSRLTIPLLLAGVTIVVLFGLSARASTPDLKAPGRWETVRMSDDWGIIFDTESGAASIVARDQAFRTGGFTRAIINAPLQFDGNSDPDGSRRASYFDQWDMDGFSKSRLAQSERDTALPDPKGK